MRRNHSHLNTLKTAKENLYEEFLNSTGSKRMDILAKIMEIDEDLENLKKDQEKPIMSKSKASSGEK